MRHAELEWHAQCLNQRGTVHQPRQSLHALYAQVQARKAARERQARLMCVAGIPLFLALVVHLTW